jgi:HD-GYP domain-containing protein (c-di-GMP phosphodiesterase class II)
MTPISCSPWDVKPQLEALHRNLLREIAGIDRIAAALYDPKTDALKTFVHSTDGESPLAHYDALLEDVPSLGELARERRPRVIDDLSVFAGSVHEHSRRLLELGYRSSYTVPFYDNGILAGFLFFDSRSPALFTTSVVEKLRVYGQLIALILLHGLTSLRTLGAAVRVASRVTHERDPETGAHLDRMSRYARLIARRLSGSGGFTDEFVEYLFLFSPLHDIGKVAIPDRILLKKGRLDDEEFELMKTHVLKGTGIVDDILGELGLESFPNALVLRNVVLRHHEAIDGSGYPDGLLGNEIPIEARIVAVADVFDALTSVRPYKEAWSPGDAFGYLHDRAGAQFDRDCVRALEAEAVAAEGIRLRFPDEGRWGRQSREGYTPDL